MRFEQTTKYRSGTVKATATAILLALASLTLGGCGSDGIAGTGLGGSSGGSGGSSVGNLLLYGGTTVPPSQIARPEEREIDCPKVDVLDGTAAFRVGSSSGGATEVSHQASLGQTARECQIQGKNVILKVGLEGRVLIGTTGKPGTFSVPVRIVVKREKTVVYSKLVKLSVTVPNGDTQAAFTYVEEGISVPLSENNPSDEYDILVGFDPTGDKAGGATKKKRR